MPTRKIRDIDPCDTRFNPCRHPSHNPPSMMVYQPGEYEHECPGCGHITRFTVYPHHFLQQPPIWTDSDTEAAYDNMREDCIERARELAKKLRRLKPGLMCDPS